MAIRIDLNNIEFQKQWFALGKEQRNAVLNCCSKMAGREWNEIYRDRGLRWEVIQGHEGSDAGRVYSIRITQKMRATVRRSDDFLEFLLLHPDHDSACH